MAAGPRRRSDVLTRAVDGELVILDQANGAVHHLNSTASLIWQECTGDRTLEQIATWLAQEVGKPVGEVMADVAGTIANLRQLSLLAEE
jgi:hypothetical protein